MSVTVDEVSLEDIDLEPRFVERVPNAASHGDYLEAAHESTYTNLAKIHLLLAKGETTLATSMLSQLRAHLDSLWAQRAEVASQGVAP